MGIFQESPTVFFLLILGVTIIAGLIVRKLMTLSLNSRYIKGDKTYLAFARNLVFSLILLVGIGVAIYLMPSLRKFFNSYVIGAGILAATFGFASQQAFSNIIGGIFTVIFKPIRIEDFIEVESKYMGWVEEINLRHTVIRNTKNERIVIPNSTFSSSTIINYNLIDPRTCSHIEFLVTAEADLDAAFRLIQEEAFKHPFTLNTGEAVGAGIEFPVDVRVISVDQWGVKIRAYVWSRDWISAFYNRCDLYKSILERFREHKIPLSAANPAFKQ